jgi:hypothetical protein
MVNYAKFAKASYGMVKGTGNKSSKTNDINKDIAMTGFVLNEEKSNKDVQYFHHPEKKKVVIAHRGSSFGSSKGIKDLTSDVMYSVGLEKHSPQFKKRAKRTNDLVKSIPDDHHVTLTGHSYGGASINHTLVTKPQVRNRVDSVQLYNPLISPFTSKTSKKTNKELNEKVIVHRTENDVPSKFYHSLPYGQVKTYKQKQHAIGEVKVLPKHLEDKFDTVEQFKAHTIDNFVD